MSIVKNIYGIFSRFSLNTAKKVKTDTVPFCEQYWKKCKADNLLREKNTQSVTLHGELNGINHFFITGANPKNMDTICGRSGYTAREMIQLTDFEFKRIKPTEEKLNVFRCIGEKPEFFSEYKLYQKRLDIKPDDIINMREYAYATSDISYAKCYLPNNKGIIYDIEVPAGARVSRTGFDKQDEIVFPRNAKFQCINTRKVKQDDADYLEVKLRYIKPKEIIS